MRTLQAFVMGQINRGNPLMVFDWAKAARLIREHQPEEAGAGLRGDWEYTGGIIWKDGKPYPEDDTYTYLASTWAVPELGMDGQVFECYIMEEKTEWDAHTYWPEEALAILRE